MGGALDVEQPPSSAGAGGRAPPDDEGAPLVVPSPLDAPDVPELLVAPDVPLAPEELVVPLVPDELDAPPSVVVVPPVTVIVRVVFATPSPAASTPLADIAATHIVMVPFVGGALKENLKVPVAPFGGGSTAPTSPGACTGNGISVF